MSTTSIPGIVLEGDTARARRTDPSNGTRGKKRIDPLTRYSVADNGCWLWQGFVGNTGYGQCWTGPAHRHFYRAHRGPIPTGMHVDHTCHVPSECAGGSTCLHRRCVNPEHLTVVTPRENVLRSNSFIARNASLTECPHGHPYAGDNVRYVRGQRVCMECTRNAWARQHAEERSRVADPRNLRPTEADVLSALAEPKTDAELAETVGVRRQTIVVARRALARAGLVRQSGTRAVVPGTRPAVVWSLT